MKENDRSTLPKIRDYSRFDQFLNSITPDVYPEPPREPHITITRTVIGKMRRENMIGPGDHILDVGCGQGVALEVFRELGMKATGITLGSDLDVCRTKGFDVHEMDQNFMSFPDGAFDVLWCRHVLEHSVAPFYTVAQYCRVSKPGGLIYVEVPAADTSAHHERGPNHYSILPWTSWVNLFTRAGCTIERTDKIGFTALCGPDMYWSFFLRTPKLIGA